MLSLEQIYVWDLILDHREHKCSSEASTESFTLDQQFTHSVLNCLFRSSLLSLVTLLFSRSVGAAKR